MTVVQRPRDSDVCVSTSYDARVLLYLSNHFFMHFLRGIYEPF